MSQHRCAHFLRGFGCGACSFEHHGATGRELARSTTASRKTPSSTLMSSLPFRWVLRVLERRNECDCYEAHSYQNRARAINGIVTHCKMLSLYRLCPCGRRASETSYGETTSPGPGAAGSVKDGHDAADDGWAMLLTPDQGRSIDGQEEGLRLA
jgi:hypothetical protein